MSERVVVKVSLEKRGEEIVARVTDRKGRYDLALRASDPLLSRMRGEASRYFIADVMHAGVDLLDVHALPEGDVGW